MTSDAADERNTVNISELLVVGQIVTANLLRHRDHCRIAHENRVGLLHDLSVLIAVVLRMEVAGLVERHREVIGNDGPLRRYRLVEELNIMID